MSRMLAAARVGATNCSTAGSDPSDCTVELLATTARLVEQDCRLRRCRLVPSVVRHRRGPAHTGPGKPRHWGADERSRLWPVRRCCRRRWRDGRGEGMASQSARSDAGPAEGGRRHQVDALLSAPKDPTVARTLAFRAKPYGKTSPFDLLTEVNRYTLYDVVDKITTPMLITDPEDEQFFPGQSCRALRRPDRPEGAGPVHGRAGIQRPLRADGATARRPADGRFLRRPARQGR